MSYTHWPCYICVSYVFDAVANLSDNFDLIKERFIWLTVLVHHGREDLEACMMAQPWCQGIRCLRLNRSRTEIMTKHGLQWPIPRDLFSAVEPCLLRFYSPKQGCWKRDQLLQTLACEGGLLIQTIIASPYYHFFLNIFSYNIF